MRDTYSRLISHVCVTLWTMLLCYDIFIRARRQIKLLFYVKDKRPMAQYNMVPILIIIKPFFTITKYSRVFVLCSV